MDGMTATEYRIRSHAIKLILEAYGAVLPQIVFNARVVVLHALAKATVAGGAMEEVVSTTYPTQPAVVTVVVLAFHSVVIEWAARACVLSKCDPALRVRAESAHSLPLTAGGAYNCSDPGAIQLVVFLGVCSPVHVRIVTMAAPVCLVAVRAD
jgi:hypothetical protein